MDALGYVLGGGAVFIILLIIRMSKKGNAAHAAITHEELSPQYKPGSYERYLDTHRTESARRTLRKLYDYWSDTPEVVRGILLGTPLPPHLAEKATELQGDNAKLLEFIEGVAGVVDGDTILETLDEPRRTSRAIFEIWYNNGALSVMVGRLINQPDEIRKLYTSMTD